MDGCSGCEHQEVNLCISLCLMMRNAPTGMVYGSLSRLNGIPSRLTCYYV